MCDGPESFFPYPSVDALELWLSFVRLTNSLMPVSPAESSLFFVPKTAHLKNGILEIISHKMSPPAKPQSKTIKYIKTDGKSAYFVSR